MTAVKGGILIGAPFPILANTARATSHTNSNLSTTLSKVGCTLMAPLVAANGSETITHVGYRQGTMVGTAASNSYTIGIQGINTSTNKPDGTYLGGGSPASAVFTPASGSNNTWVWVALANSISINRGQKIALVIERTAGTDASNYIPVASSWGGSGNTIGFGLSHTHNGSVWATSPDTARGCLGFKSASNIYGFPFNNLYASQNASGTTEIGNFFTVPSYFCSTCKVLGVRVRHNAGTAGSGMRVTLYSSPTSSPSQIAQSNELLFDETYINSSSDRTVEMMFADSSLPDLSAGTTYCLGVSATASSSSSFGYMDVATSTDFEAWHGADWAMSYSSRTLTDYPPSGNDTGNWAASTATKRLLMELIIGDIVAPSGGGTGRGLIF